MRESKRERLNGWGCLMGLMAAMGVAETWAGPVDIRGLSFVDPHVRTETEGGIVDVFGTPVPIETYPPDPVTGERESQTLTPLPHTFDVAADPAAPADPSHIQLNTRLFFAGGGSDPACPDAVFTVEPTGTYDSVTGEFHVSGTRMGTHLHHFYGGPDPFGVFPFDIFLIGEYTDLSLSLNGVLTEGGDGSLTITGTDPYIPFGGPGNISVASANVYVLPFGECDPANALAAYPVSDAYGGIYDWSATYVPEPGSVALVLVGGWVIVGKRKSEFRSKK